MSFIYILPFINSYQYSKDEEMLLYTMQKGQMDKFDMIKFINETREKHKKPDSSKPSDMQCTKNLLRNLNQSMIRFLQRSAISQCDQDQIKKFIKWATLQKMDNFQQCRNLWTFNESNPLYEYLDLFREIQFDFFADSSCPAIFSSKVRNDEGRKTHLKYIHTFLEGIICPELFTCFKKSGKLIEQQNKMPSNSFDKNQKNGISKDNNLQESQENGEHFDDEIF